MQAETVFEGILSGSGDGGVRNRRDVLKLGGAIAACSGLRPVIGQTAVIGQLTPVPGTTLAPQTGLPPNWRSIGKIDAHNHVFGALQAGQGDWSKVEALVEAAELLGIDTLCCSQPITGGRMASSEEVREANDAILAAMQRYPTRISGYCFLQPGNGQACLDELERCLTHGMIGVKLYNQYKYTDPLVFPIIERCIDHRIPVLGHSAHLTDPRSIAAQPNTSDSLDFCQLAGRYPESMLILGHINGGGDWEWAIKGVRNCPNVWVDTSGSNMDNDTMDRCVAELGYQRVLFATDQTMEGGVGKLLSADLNHEQLAAIFSENMRSILKRRI